MEVVKLKARPRTGTGKSYTRKIRKQGWVPAVYYGHNMKTKNIEVDAREFGNIIREKKTSHLINLDLPEEKRDSTSVIKEIQRHVLKDNLFFHVDFQHVAMDEKITVNCPLQLIGEAIGVIEDGGILGHPKRTITIECLPANIPEYITVDVSELHIGNSIHIKDLEVPNVVIKDSPDDVIAVVAHPQAVVEEEPAVSEKVEEEAEAKEGAEVKEGAEEAEGVKAKEGKKETEAKKLKDEKSGRSRK